jgi:hypothetical protein
VKEGQRLGFKIMPMFGANALNRKLANFSSFADGATARGRRSVQLELATGTTIGIRKASAST